MKQQKKMKKWVKIIIIIFCALLVLVGSAATVYFSGILVKPTADVLSRLTEVPDYDILDWQFERENEILDDYSHGSYSMQNPYIFVDPYEMNPCSALVMFETESPSDIMVTITGDDGYSTITYTKQSGTTHCEVPIIGLYAGRKNAVVLSDGKDEEIALSIQTEPLPADFQTYKLEQSQPAKMEPGITLFTACFENSYTALLDCYGQVRGYLSNQDMSHGTSMIVLENGNMLATGDEYRQLPYNMKSLWEFNWLGKVFKEYEIPNGVHHDLRQVENGDFIATSNNLNMFTSGTREDVVIIVDAVTGEIKKEIDFRNILDEKRDPYHHFHPDIKNAPNIDWMHINGAEYNSENDTIIVSSPTQSQIICIDSKSLEIEWILGPHEGYEGSSAFLKEFLLIPLGEDFEWQWGQHHPMILPDQDNDPNTLDLLVFDNGQSKSFEEESATSAIDNYSRGVIFRIDQKEKTVEQLWQYGKERGSECYATFLGDANYLPVTENILITFGGQLRADGVPTDNIVSGVFGTTATNSRVVEVTQSGEVVFEVSARENDYTNSAETYQAKRIQLFQNSSFAYQLGTDKAERLGTVLYSKQTSDINAPNIFIGNIEANFDRIYQEQKRLIVAGGLTIDGKAPVLARSYLIFRSKDNVYIYETAASLNGRFFASIDTSELNPGEYAITVAGGISGDNDVLTNDLTSGYMKTPFKITIP